MRADSNVTEISVSEVQSAAAYVLFYRRRSTRSGDSAIQPDCSNHHSMAGGDDGEPETSDGYGGAADLHDLYE